MKNKKLLFIIAGIAVIFNLLMFGVFYPYNSMPDSYTEAKNGVVFIYSDFSSKGYGTTGSGFAIGGNGNPVQYIVTNYHVVFDEETGDKADEVVVYFSAAANRYMVAQIYRYSAARDIAVLRLPEATTEVEPLKLCKSASNDLGETFYALGYPARATAGTDYERYDKSEIVTTSGMISRQTMINEEDVYMLDLDITSGNSGGPLVNKKGAVVGINTFSITDTSGDATNYAICIDELTRMLDSEIEYVLTTDINVKGLVIIIIAAIVDLAVFVFILLCLIKKNKKSVNQYQEYGRPQQPAAMKKQEIGSTVAVGDISSTVAVSGSIAVVTGVEGACKGQSFVVKDKLIFGRDPKRCNVILPLDAEGVSGLHCQITTGSAGVKLKDLGSTYGTFVQDGLKISQNTEVELSDGDTFCLGSEKTKFSISIR